MPRISDCPEWAILNTLKIRIQQRCRRFDPRRSEPFATVELREELDTALRGFLLKVTNQETPEIARSDFEHCRTSLGGLCLILNQLVDPSLGHSRPRPGRPYAGLHTINETLALSKHTYSVISGPGHRLFQIPETKDKEALTDIMSLIARTGNLVSGLNPAAASETTLDRALLSQTKSKSKKKPWKDFKRRDRAKRVIGLLFADLCARCPDQVNHSVLLQAPGTYEMEDPPQELNLMISECPDTSKWVNVLSISTRRESMALLQSLCRTVQENTGVGKYLCLYVAEYMLHGEWCTLSTHAESSHLQLASNSGTLAQLISDGVFKPASLTWARREAKQPEGSLSRFTPMEKRKLALQLGYCLLDFFNADVSSQQVYFVSLTDTSLRSEPPYLSFSPPQPADKGSSNGQHTSILSFAELLLEIEIGEKKPPAPNGCLEEDIIITTWSELNSMTILLERQNNSSYTQAIRGCLEAHLEISKNPKFWGPTKNEDAEDGYDKSTLRKVRKILYEKVIRKLETGLEESIPQRHSKRTRSDVEEEYSSFIVSEEMESVPKRRLIGGLDEQTSQHSSSSAGGRFDDTSPAEYPTEKCRSADAFIQTHRDIYSAAFDLRNADLKKMGRVKIAVLDTGCDISHPQFLANVGRIKGMKTWVPMKSETDVSDSFGHGTHVIGLLLDIAPDSDIYIAQVTEDKSVSPSVAAEAVLHAIREWDVDIITMSFGFAREEQEQETEPPEISLTDAILEAHRSRVLLFAAASNTGAYGLRPSFPARYTGVMCIYSGDGHGNSAATNPTSRQNDYNFLTLGEAVESAWPVDLAGPGVYRKRKSGTSFATPIAAGLAACLMLDTRRLLSREDARRLNEYDKMKALLSHLSKVRNGYHVISVKEYFDEDPEGRRKQLRKCLDGTLL